MTPAFQTFINRLQEAKDRSALSAALSGFADSLGFTRFGYLGLPRPTPHQPVYVTTYPLEWVTHYESRRYQEIDPVVMQTRNSMLPFFWDSQNPGPRASQEQRRFFGEAAEFGVGSGFAVPIHNSQGGIAVVSLVSDEKPLVLRRHVEKNQHLLHLASIYFHVHARQKLESAIELEQPHLSEREISCLQWVARGKSSWDIAEILSISRRTVVFHIENAKRKLDAVTLPQAIAIALQNRAIEF